MTIINERNIDIPVSPAERERDTDIHALAIVSSRIDAAPGMYFVLTGSYAIEALTGNPLHHDDIDANIFATDLSRDLQRTDVLIEELGTPGNRFRIYKKTADRLEYDLLSTSGRVAPRRLEIQFIEISDVSGDQEKEFGLNSEERGFYRVPTVVIPLRDSTGEEYMFRVKSLSYVIATWIIRISGLTQNPKRPVRDSDLDTLRLLLAKEYSYEDVVLAMSGHPQMSKEASVTSALERTFAVLSRRKM